MHKTERSDSGNSANHKSPLMTGSALPRNNALCKGGGGGRWHRKVTPFVLNISVRHLRTLSHGKVTQTVREVKTADGQKPHGLPAATTQPTKDYKYTFVLKIFGQTKHSRPKPKSPPLVPLPPSPSTPLAPSPGPGNWTGSAEQPQCNSHTPWPC